MLQPACMTVGKCQDNLILNKVKVIKANCRRMNLAAIDTKGLTLVATAVVFSSSQKSIVKIHVNGNYSVQSCRPVKVTIVQLAVSHPATIRRGGTATKTQG